MSERKVTGILRAIEQWGSESDQRAQLLVLLVWAGFGAVVLAGVLIAAWIMLPPGYFF
jgi:hypothetical protein